MSNDLETRIISHHVGGRGFVVAFNTSDRFKEDIVQVLYEGDAQCANEMIGDNGQKNRYVLPYCLGREDGPGKINITHNPYASSNLWPNPYYKEWACEVKLPEQIYDAVYGELFHVEHTVDVNIRSLDSLVDQNLIPDSSLPDFLSLDTQGSEYQILEGAEKTIRKGMLGVATEIEFHPMYSGQKLFSDLLTHLNGLGFHFANFLHLEEITPKRVPIGFRGKGFVAFGDALFLRRLEELPSLAKDDDHLYVLAHKLAFIAISFQQIEYGLKALELAVTLRPNARLIRALEKHTYFQFLRRFHALACHMEEIFPPTEPDGSAPVKAIQANGMNFLSCEGWLGPARRVYSRVYSKCVLNSEKRIQQLIFTRPQEAVFKIVDYFFRIVVRAWRNFSNRFKTRKARKISPAQAGMTGGYTAVESLMFEYHLPLIGDKIRKRREEAQRYSYRK